MNRTIEQFRNGDLVINCRTQKDANTLMLLFDKYLIKWDRNKPASSNSSWSKHAEKTGYHCGPQELLYIDSIDCYSEKNRQTIEFNDFIKNLESEQPTQTPNIETAIKDVIATSLDSGLIERLVKENLEKGVNTALEHLFGNYGDATKLIENEIKSVIVKQLESFDYSQYITKLDTVLVEILENTTLDNRKILGNFKSLMTSDAAPKQVTVSDIFETFNKRVATDIDTSKLQICDDEPAYQNVEPTLDIEYKDKPSWSNSEQAILMLTCEEDSHLDCEIALSRYSGGDWTIDRIGDATIRSLQYLSDFQIYLLQLSQRRTKIEIDQNFIKNEIEVEAEPEASYN